MKKERMKDRVEYVREHYSKEVRTSLLESISQVKGDGEKTILKGFKLKRKKQRVWTLNRSPHGNKTAREQFGRQVWQRRRERNQTKDRETRKQRMKTQEEYVSRKEICVSSVNA